MGEATRGQSGTEGGSAGEGEGRGVLKGENCCDQAKMMVGRLVSSFLGCHTTPVAGCIPFGWASLSFIACH